MSAITSRVRPSLKSDQPQFEFRQSISDAGLRSSGRAEQILKSHREMLIRKEHIDRHTSNIDGAGLQRFTDPSYTGRGSINTTVDMYLNHRLDSRGGYGYMTSAEARKGHPYVSAVPPNLSVPQTLRAGYNSVGQRSPKTPPRKRPDDDYRYVGYGYSAK